MITPERETKEFIRHVLIYIGEGIKYLSIPARDLTADDVEKYGGFEAIRATGLYATPEEIRFDGG